LLVAKNGEMQSFLCPNLMFFFVLSDSNSYSSLLQSLFCNYMLFIRLNMQGARGETLDGRREMEDVRSERLDGRRER